MLEGLESLRHNPAEKWESPMEQFGVEADPIPLLLDMHPNIIPSRFIKTVNRLNNQMHRTSESQNLIKRQ